MYKCAITGRLSKPNEKLNKIVVETRAKTYVNWDYEAEEEWQSFGTEIVKEVDASEAGLKLWNAWTPEQRLEFTNNLA